MIIRKLRLQRGWSQEQLAELTGLSTRTIQRIERGQPCSLETIKALAAVFEVDLSTFKPEERYTMGNDNPAITPDEQDAIRYVQGLKAFYGHLGYYVFFIGIFAVIWYLKLGYLPGWILWWAAGWGIGLLAHGLQAFELFNPISADWERRQVEKRLKRRL
ncbi:MAG TPA: helix-turn-helix domain-containing protein [Pseudomonadaceae bacterium]|nr:helix-turn-helix domain-containing protein [Pseudomonadaceae bacterium]